MWRRILRSLQYHKTRNGLLFLLYTACFSLLFLLAVLNIASGKRLEDMQTVLGDAVYVRKMRTVDLGQRNNLAPFRPEEIEELASDDRVKGSNVIVYHEGNLAEGEPYYVDEERFEEYLEYLRGIEYDLDTLDNCRFVGVTDSRLSVFFTGVGMKLVKGSGIEAEDAGEKVALVSQALAEKNGWDVGDRVSFMTGKYNGFRSPTEFEAVIKGIFDCSEIAFEETKYRPWDTVENYVFFPYSTLYGLDMVLYQPYMVYIYMKDSGMAEGYMQDMRELLGYGQRDFTAEGNPQVDLMFSWNDEWNQIVSMPLQEIHQITNAALWVTLIGIVSIIFFLCYSELQKKYHEIGIWVAMGEKRVVLLAQLLIEQMVPVLLAAAIGLAAAFWAAEPVSGRLVSGSPEGLNEELAWDRENTLFHERYYDIEEELRAGNYNFYYISTDLAVYQHGGAIAGALCVGAATFTGGMAVLTWTAVRRRAVQLLKRSGGE